jgi:hypothetical protein|tara:strand:+ start:3315 stop:5516 length:2202 start_codon:yes stop_codon:yes gene_type:complete
MAFTVSPGVVTREIDLTTIVPETGTTAGAFAGAFRWGPIDKIVNVSSEDLLVENFQKPDSSTYLSFFSAANFLAYGQNLNVVRVANSSAYNATTDSANAVLIKSDESYYNTYYSEFGGSGPSNDFGEFASKFAGELGNSMKVSLCGADIGAAALTGTAIIAFSGTEGTVTGTSTAFTSELQVNDVLYHNSSSYYIVTAIGTDSGMTVQSSANTDVTGATEFTRAHSSHFREREQGWGSIMGTVQIADTARKVMTGTGTYFDLQLTVGDKVTISGETLSVSAITSNTSATLSTSISPSAAAITTSVEWEREWEFASNFDYAPTTSDFATRRDVTNDEVHVIIIDEDGEWTGVKGTVLEIFPALSVASDAKSEDGQALYYKEAINRRSKYIWWMKHPNSTGADTAPNTAAWGTSANSASKPAYTSNRINMTASMSGGADGQELTDANIIGGYDKFKSAEDVDVSLIITGAQSTVVNSYLISNIAEVRKDCMVFISPEQADVVNNDGSEVGAVNDFRNLLPSSSYSVIDCGWKYQYDKYNDTFRYIPLNPDIAGLVVRTTVDRDFFFSPAGFNRGQVKNVARLAWNPNKTQRDLLYKNGVNPVVSFAGQGTLLFGDKTLLAKPSAFDRINVRRLFITLEKSIANFARFSMFEFNDDFTRSSFVSSVEPFLRDIQGRGGITDFAVVCDESNNTQEVIDRNEFIGSIFVKPTKSINFVLLNFVAVRSGVEFEEVVNAV